MTGYRILAASYTDRITSLLFDPTGPSLKVTSEVKVGARPSWLTVHPSDPSLIFTGLENLEGVVVALKYDKDGNGTIVGQIPSGGADPASLLATADTLFVGNVRARRFLPSLMYAPQLIGIDYQIVFVRDDPGGSSVHVTALLVQRLVARRWRGLAAA
jgi:hypothetical protein